MKRARRGFRPRVEALEDRTLPAGTSIVVQVVTSGPVLPFAPGTQPAITAPPAPLGGPTVFDPLTQGTGFPATQPVTFDPFAQAFGSPAAPTTTTTTTTSSTNPNNWVNHATFPASGQTILKPAAGSDWVNFSSWSGTHVVPGPTGGGITIFGPDGDGDGVVVILPPGTGGSTGHGNGSSGSSGSSGSGQTGSGSSGHTGSGSSGQTGSGSSGHTGSGSTGQTGSSGHSTSGSSGHTGTSSSGH